MFTPMIEPSVFLDRDGVLIRDVHNLTQWKQVELIPGSAAAVGDLRQAGLAVVVVTNQPVVARGWMSERQVRNLHHRLRTLLRREGADVTGFYFCPHHQSATLPAYRCDCPCRKPRPGMLLKAAEDLSLDLRRSFMVGDRVTDVLAGRAAGCTTILVESGRHAAAPIQTSEPVDLFVQEDYRCRDLRAASQWIIEQTSTRPLSSRQVMVRGSAT
jgi:D-glycero-D-manno-heptose 1,7-bisphosphate phosphatase